MRRSHSSSLTADTRENLKFKFRIKVVHIPRRPGVWKVIHDDLLSLSLPTLFNWLTQLLDVEQEDVVLVNTVCSTILHHIAQRHNYRTTPNNTQMNFGLFCKSRGTPNSVLEILHHRGEAIHPRDIRRIMPELRQAVQQCYEDQIQEFRHYVNSEDFGSVWMFAVDNCHSHHFDQRFSVRDSHRDQLTELQSKYHHGIESEGVEVTDNKIRSCTCRGKCKDL
mmetsp:Transcript_31664/g.49576  ORF Transcript_31664/g.49576 Transcript_31664/m.49576 type:complete len:222 (+) Transcript_31664:356-1021(+)